MAGSHAEHQAHLPDPSLFSLHRQPPVSMATGLDRPQFSVCFTLTPPAVMALRQCLAARAPSHRRPAVLCASDQSPAGRHVSRSVADASSPSQPRRFSPPVIDPKLHAPLSHILQRIDCVLPASGSTERAGQCSGVVGEWFASQPLGGSTAGAPLTHTDDRGGAGSLRDTGPATMGPADRVLGVRKRLVSGSGKCAFASCEGIRDRS